LKAVEDVFTEDPNKGTGMMFCVLWTTVVADQSRNPGDNYRALYEGLLFTHSDLAGIN